MLHKHLIFGGLAALAVGFGVGLGSLVKLPANASAPTIRASIQPTTPSSAPSVRTQAVVPDPAQPAPRPVAEPQRQTRPAPAPVVAQVDAPEKKPVLRVDPERNTLRFDAGGGGIDIDKERMKVRSPLGAFEFRW